MAGPAVGLCLLGGEEVEAEEEGKGGREEKREEEAREEGWGEGSQTRSLRAGKCTEGETRKEGSDRVWWVLSSGTLPPVSSRWARRRDRLAGDV